VKGIARADDAIVVFGCVGGFAWPGNPLRRLARPANQGALGALEVLKSELERALKLAGAPNPGAGGADLLFPGIAKNVRNR
jgi:hypothetical protein